MIKLFCARECIDKEKFIYEHVEGETFVIVPEQYTLVAEEQALRYLGVDCLYDVEIISLPRLGLRMLREQGEENVKLLSRYGRFMLLTKIIGEHKDDLKFYARAAGKLSFTTMVDDFISEFKQQDCTMAELEALQDDSESGDILRAKLGELKGIVESYERELEGRLTDAEDYVNLYIDAMRRSEALKTKEIWIYAYDSISSKIAAAVTALAECSRGVNIIINESDFDLHDKTIDRLVKAAEESGIGISCERIEGEKYELAKCRTIKHIEKYLWKDDVPEEPENREPEGLTIVQCANQYYEAESAAAYIHGLIRDEGYRLRDITLICNGEDSLQIIMKRILAEYGLPVFCDSNRDIKDSVAAGLIVNQLEFIRRGYSSDNLFAMLKTGLAGISREDTEALENYARKYNIKGRKWTRDFSFGAFEYGEEGLEALNRTRAAAVEPLLELERISKGAENIGAFIEAYDNFLESRYELSDRIEQTALKQEELDMPEEAMRTRESYEELISLLGQVTEIMADCPMDISEFTDIYTAGLMDVEVGVIPPSVDGLSMGTIIRTRPRPAKAVVVVGANEGITPLNPSTEGLFSVDEKEYFRRHNFALGSLDDIKMSEENVAMYRILSHASEKLYVSYSMTDAEGGELQPSPIVDALTELFPDAVIHKDIISEGWGPELVNDSYETLRHLINHIKDRNTPAAGDELTAALLGWYKGSERAQTLGRLLDAAQDDNVAAPLAAGLARALYARAGGAFVLSASKVEQYENCPFKFFVDYGLRPSEERNYESDARTIGDIYHECLMRIAAKLGTAVPPAAPGALPGAQSGDTPPAAASSSDLQDAPAAPPAAAPTTGAASANSLDDESIAKLVNDTLDEIAAEYRGGLFVSSGNEEFRLERIKEICCKASKAMIKQLESGAVKDIFVEEKYGKGCRFGPVGISLSADASCVDSSSEDTSYIDTSSADTSSADASSIDASLSNDASSADTSSADASCETVYIEGKIDRADILDGDCVRIIDYKTGGERVDLKRMTQGYKMQLMIYMMSAISGNYEPAGMFYFNIKDNEEAFNDIAASKEEAVLEAPEEDSYKLSGKYIDEPGMLDKMPAEALSGRDDINRISRDYFDSIMDQVKAKLTEIAEGITQGDISISPLRPDKQRISCSFCDYRSICRYDSENGGNRSREL